MRSTRAKAADHPRHGARLPRRRKYCHSNCQEYLEDKGGKNRQHTHEQLEKRLGLKY